MQTDGRLAAMIATSTLVLFELMSLDTYRIDRGFIRQAGP